MSNMELIKKLRDTTGSGIVDCKKALAENNDDLDAAVKWLREKGILKAQKKQDRETNEGVISFYNHEISASSFALCQIKCETDFVAKNEDFLSTVTPERLPVAASEWVRALNKVDFPTLGLPTRINLEGFTPSLMTAPVPKSGQLLLFLTWR